MQSGHTENHISFLKYSKTFTQKGPGQSIRMIMSSDKKSTITPIQLLKKLLQFSPTVQVHLCFSNDQKKKNQTVSALITAKRLSRLSCMLWLSFTYGHTFFSMYGCRHFEKWSTQAFFKRRESRIQRKVWNEERCSSPAKLYPHILIKRLHNGWPKKHKENIKKKEKFKRGHLLVPGKLINST